MPAHYLLDHFAPSIIEPPTPPPTGLILPGLYDEAALVPRTTRLTATTGQIIENFDFTQATAESQVFVPQGTRGPVICRNCRFRNSGTDGSNGAAIQTWWEVDVIVHNCEFEDSFRAIHSLGGNGGLGTGDHSVLFILNKGKNLYRNFGMMANTKGMPGTRIFAYNEMEWTQGKFDADFPIINRPVERDLTVADGFASYQSDDVWQLGNRIRSIGAEANPDTNGATYSIGDSGGSTSKIDRNFSWNGANNGAQVSSGSGNQILDNIIYHDGRDPALQAPIGGENWGPGVENSWITNRGLVWQAWGEFGAPTNGVSDGNTVFYRNPGGGDLGFTVKDGSPFPSGDDPLGAEPNVGPSNWDGVTGPGTPQEVWDNWWIDGLGAQAIADEGLFGVVIP